MIVYIITFFFLSVENQRQAEENLHPGFNFPYASSYPYHNSHGPHHNG